MDNSGLSRHSGWIWKSALLSLAIGATAFTPLPILAAYNADDEPITLSKSNSRFDFRPGELIVKFKSDSKLKIRSNAKGRFASAGISSVDKALNAIGAESLEQLMPLTGKQSAPKKLKAFNGSTVEVKDLSTLYVVKLGQKEPADVMEAIDELNKLEEVEYAEPNYILHALETDWSQKPDDPYYDLQYGISDINLYQLWPQPVISKDGPVIAILDTGVEVEHPDLENNIWNNPQECGGAESYDDDNNGFVDDLHGWDFVNKTGKIADYNGHGTHCAGIAAACGFNGKGIVGANPHARIMPVTVLQSNGKGDLGTIIKGLDYAVANGADIISMSLGTYSNSMALEEALGRAYSKCVLIAAAGNDGFCLNHAHPERRQMKPMPMFPAAYTFVLGVQASAPGGGLASFSNYDDNGPAFSEYREEQLYNYELKVPGASIISTYPGGTYKHLNGTSMATPLVAGAVSRLLQAKEYTNKEELFGDLINSVTPAGNLDIYRAYTIRPEDRIPELQFVTLEMVDADGDGRADAGEEVSFYPVIRNTWGNVSNIVCSVENGEAADNNWFEILDGKTEFGSTLSSYGKAKPKNPLRIKFSKDIADGRNVLLKFSVYGDNAETIEKILDVKVENAVTLTGILREDMTLTPDQHYVITGTFGVPKERTLTILPGTTVKFRDKSDFIVEGKLIADGEPGNMIRFTKADLDLGNINDFDLGNNSISYCIFEDLCTKLRKNIDCGSVSKSLFRNLSGGSIVSLGRSGDYSNCSLYNFTGNTFNFIGYYTFTNCNITNIIQDGVSNDDYGIHIGSGRDLRYCNVFANYFEYQGSVLMENGSISLDGSRGMGIYHAEEPCYLGTGLISIAKNRVLDINHPGNAYYGTRTEYDFSNMPTRPNAEAPGIVWKVVVNDFDAQDQFDELPPLGVGRHKFEVYFNRPMNKAVTPVIGMGVRPPYTQTSIGEDGEWNADGTVYTAYLTISGKDNIDGLNRIHVSAAEDDEFFPIPVENTRFNVLVQAAGSMSEGFYAEAGLGKVDLVWETSEDEIDDVLGYNVYRYNVDDEGNQVDSIQLNRRLVDVTNFTDYDVVPGKTYLYYYTTLRTNLTENSPSKVVAAMPLTASKGDANGSMSVDVADVVTEVNYIIGGNPQPFIFEAADVNDDTDINVLDIVGTINIINTPLGGAGSSAVGALSTARFTVEDGVLYMECDQPAGGLQVRLNGDRANTEITRLTSLDGFEEISNWLTDNEYLYMAFSMSNRTIAPGKHALLRIGAATISEVKVSDVTGANMPVEIKNGSAGINVVESEGDFRVYPNPATDVVNIDYTMPADCKAFFVVSNLRGSLVGKCSRMASAGRNSLRMNVASLPSGVYFIRMFADGRALRTFKFIKK